MPRSLANGDYSLVMAVESSSRTDSWYRILADRQTGALSCDCPPWTFKQDARQLHPGVPVTILASPSNSREWLLPRLQRIQERSPR